MAAQTKVVATGAVATLKSDSSKTDSLLRTALRRIRRDKLTLMAIGLLLTLSTLSLLAPSSPMF